MLRQRRTVKVGSIAGRSGFITKKNPTVLSRNVLHNPAERVA